MRRESLLLLLVLCMAACSGDAVPVAPTEVQAPEAVVESPGGVRASAGQSVCYAVKFQIDLHWPTFEGDTEHIGGDVTGDLEGTAEMVFSLGPDAFGLFGVVSKNLVEATANWEVTGGVLGATDFQTTLNNKDFVIDRPGSPGTLFENIGTHKALAGVRQANLTYKGTFDLLQPGQPGTHYYHGVICP